MTQFNTGLTQGNSFRGEVESVKGQKLLDRAFPAGANAPIDVVVADQARARAVQAALRADPRIAAVPPAVAPVPKAVVIVLVCLLQSEQFRSRMVRLFGGRAS